MDKYSGLAHNDTSKLEQMHARMIKRPNSVFLNFFRPVTLFSKQREKFSQPFIFNQKNKKEYATSMLLQILPYASQTLFQGYLKNVIFFKTAIKSFQFLVISTVSHDIVVRPISWISVSYIIL